jgi:C4-dicarboxylate-specific signal transduction histidine kinase
MEMAEQFNKQQLLLAKVEASNIQSYIGNVKNEMLRIAQIASTFQVKKETLYEFLMNGVFVDVNRVKMGINLLDSEGKILYTRGDLAIEKSYIKDFVEIAKRFCPSESFIKQDENRVYMVTPVCRSGSVIKAVVASIDIQDLAREFLSPIKSGSRGYAWMMNGSGDLLYHPTQPEMVGRNLYKTDTSCFKCHKSFDVEKKIIEGKSDYYGKYVAPSGEDKVLAFSTASIGDLKWIVAVSAPYSEITMSIQTSMKFHSWIIILIFLTTSVVSAILIILNKKRVKGEELEKHKKELEIYAEDLEQKVNIRTKELTEEKEKLNTIVSTIGSGIILIDNQRKIQWTNQTMKKIAGKNITGMLCDDFFADCKIIGTYKVNNLQTDILSNLFGQRGKYFQVTTAPIGDADEGVKGYIRLIHDVTEMKRLEEQLIHSEKLALFGRLTAGIAHEIGSPLTSVFSFVQILKDMEKDEFKKESLETIYLHMNRIADILKQLSGFSKMPQVEHKPWKVNSLIEDSLSLIQYDRRVKDITIVKDLLSDMPKITTDKNQLSQVIVNIVLNAADAMPDGGTLKIKSNVKDKTIVISFEDTGVGIPDENLIKIFDPYFTTKEKGTGLGLTVSHSIIEKLNGHLTVESELNKGSRFVITLPTD